jgi:hypothetical protein
VANPHGSDDTWVIIDVVEYIFVKVYFDISSKFVKKYSKFTWMEYKLEYTF